MTGMDVLRRCRSYKKDIERLNLRRMCAQDVATRSTRSMDVSGHVGGMTDAMGNYVARVDEIDRMISIRKEMYAIEREAAAVLIAGFSEPMQGIAMYHGWLCGLTTRQTAAVMKNSESAVRGLRRRGREILEGLDAELDTNPEYLELSRMYDLIENAH